MDSFAVNLKRLRTASGLTQQALGAIARIDPTLVCRYERGLSIPREHVRRLTAALREALAKAESRLREARTLVA
jgi:transcriptional regulator with XRE-family HTH domain